MKNKILIVVFIIISFASFNIGKLFGQVTLSANDTGWINVTSYGGGEYQGSFTLFMAINGASINHPKWSLLVRGNVLNINSGSEILELSNKIKIRLNRVGQGPSIQQIGANKTPVPLSNSNNLIFYTETAPIKPSSGGYGQFVFYFDILVDGGAHLEALKEKGDYKLNLIFTVETGGNEFLAESNQVGTIMTINPKGIPPSGPTYSIQVNSTARNGLLEFKNMTDYVNGVSQNYPKGLSVVSTTPYQVQVRSLKTNFEADNNTLPVSAVSLEIKDPANTSVGGIKPLSENAQTIFSATNVDKKPRMFDIRYFTQPNDERMLYAKPASYQTTLMYTLVPQ